VTALVMLTSTRYMLPYSLGGWDQGLGGNCCY